MQMRARQTGSGKSVKANSHTDLPGPVRDVLRSPGRPLEPATRTFMEPRFGHDFGRVRVHVGDEAARSAQSMNALAYTFGHDIVFGRNGDPFAQPRSELVAHELAHVVQYDRGLSLSLRRAADDDEDAGDEDTGDEDAVEEQADAMSAFAANSAPKTKKKKKKKKKKAKAKPLSLADVKSYVSSNNKSSSASDNLIVCLIWKESGFDPTEKNSRSSATGLMQMTTGAVEDVNQNSPKGTHFTHSQMTDPAKNIECGTLYLQMRIDRKKGDITAGLNAFGTGSGYADNILACEKCLKAAQAGAETPCLGGIHK